MAIVHVCGFGTLPVTGDFVSAVSPEAMYGPSVFSRQVGRNGGYSIRHTNTGYSGNNSSFAGKLRISGSPWTEFSLGFAMNHRSSYTPSSGSMGIVLLTGAGDWTMNFGTGTAPQYGAAPYGGVSNWTTVNGSPTGLGWHWWNFVFKAASSGGICALYRDGVLMGHANGDTDQGVSYTNTALYVYVGNDNVGAQCDVADLVYKNDATVIPETSVVSLFPDGTTANGWFGSDSDKVDNHLLVNENPTYNAATYVGSAAVNALDTYTVANLPNAASSVSAVQVGVRAFKSDAGVKTLSPMINGVAGAATDPGGGSTIYQLATTNPSGGAAWDTTSVNAMNVGIKVIS